MTVGSEMPSEPFDSNAPAADPAGLDAAPASGPMLWVVRIGMTIFTLPFFAAGIGMVFGVGMFGERGDGFGWFIRLFGLGFMAVPTMMLFGVWMAKPRASRLKFTDVPPPPDPAPASQTAATINPVPRISCRYCGRARPVDSTACPSCGAA